MSENYINNYTVTVGSGGITSGATSLPVSAGASVDSGFRLLIGTELLLVTAGGTTTTWTVTRGIEGSTAAAHVIGDVINIVLTATSLDQIRISVNGYGALASIPVSGMKLGDVYRCSDSPLEAVFDGSVWQYLLPGIGKIGKPPASGWSYVNQASASLNSATGTLIWTLPNSSTSDRYILRTPTYTSTPWSYIGGITVFASNVNFFDYGLLIRKSTGNKLVWGGIAVGVIRFVNTVTTSDATGAGILNTGGGVPLRFKITNDGTTISCYISYTCQQVSWTLMGTDTAANVGTIDGVGFVAMKYNNSSGFGAADTLEVWDFQEFNSVV